MALKIKTTKEVTKSNVVVTIYGTPGAGKTTFSLTSEKPVIFDFDKGIQRIYNATGDEAVVEITAWQDVLDMQQSDLADFNTVIVDTVGAMTQCLQTYHEQKGVKGFKLYGEIGNSYLSFINKIKSWGKDLVIISHFSEEKSGEETKIRLSAVGSKAKDDVYQSSDLIGFLSANGNKRTVDFSPTDGKIGKNTGGFDVLDIAKIDLSQIINQLKNNINAKFTANLEKQKDIKQVSEFIKLATNIDELNELMQNQIVQQNNQLKVQLVAQAKALNCEVSKDKTCFVELPKSEPKSDLSSDELVD